MISRPTSGSFPHIFLAVSDQTQLRLLSLIVAPPEAWLRPGSSGATVSEGLLVGVHVSSPCSAC